MRMLRKISVSIAPALLLSLLGGCGASISPGSLAGSPAEPSAGLSLPKASSILPQTDQVIGTPTELYTRIARGALTCWFGAAGPLKDEYIYHADADPPSKGGRSQIIIHVRDKTKISNSEQKSVRAFRVVIAPAEPTPTVESENFKLAEPLAARLTSDVRRWAADNEGCSEAPAANWNADDAKAAGKSNKADDKQKPKPSQAAGKTPAKKPAASKAE